MYSVRHYLTGDRRDPFSEWLDSLRDSLTKILVLRRINRLAQVNFGDHRLCRDGVWELKIDHGPGYRVYYALDGSTVVLLLLAGSRKSQSADITRAVECWKDWQRRAAE